MIVSLINISASNNSGQKRVSVYALNDGNPGKQKITFTVIDQTHSVTKQFAAHEAKSISTVHTATGTGFIAASAGTAHDRRFCDVDHPQGKQLSAADIQRRGGLHA